MNESEDQKAEERAVKISRSEKGSQGRNDFGILKVQKETESQYG